MKLNNAKLKTIPLGKSVCDGNNLYFTRTGPERLLTASLCGAFKPSRQGCAVCADVCMAPNLANRRPGVNDTAPRAAILRRSRHAGTAPRPVFFCTCLR